MTLGEKIRNAREDADLSQTEISALIPMNQSNYSKIERDIQEPNMHQLRRICEILAIDANYLLNVGESIISTDDRRLLADVKALIRKYSEK